MSVKLPISVDYQAGKASKFTGKIAKVMIDIKPGGHDGKNESDSLRRHGCTLST